LAIRNLAALVERAPVQAERVVAAAEKFAVTGFPDRGRRVPERKQRYLAVPPQGIFYRVVGDDLIIVAVRDARRRRKPW